MNEILDMTEMGKLAQGLVIKQIPFQVIPMFNGLQILCKDWDAICHSGSYGHSEGLLEIYGSIVQSEYDDVEGYLTAEEILERL